MAVYFPHSDVAIQQGLFNNEVLYTALSNRNTDRANRFTGSIIRNIFSSNGFSVPSGISSLMLGQIFEFTGSGLHYYPVPPRFGHYNQSTLIKFRVGNSPKYTTIGTTLWNSGITLQNLFDSAFNLEAAIALANSNEVDFVERIIDNLKFTENCVHKILSKGRTTFLRNLLDNFLEPDSEFDVIIYSVPKIQYTLPNGQVANPAGATLFEPGTNIMNIVISSEAANNSSNLITIRNILHEYIHAEVYRRVYNTIGTTEADYNFGLVYNAYNEKFNVDHQLMADNYLQSMAETLKAIHETDLKEDYDNLTELLKSEYPNGLTLDFYKRLSWEGLQDAKAWNNLQVNDPE